METNSTIDARIEEIRKGDITVKAGPGVEVTINQVRHEFLFGTAITDNIAEKAKNAMSVEDRTMFLKILGENFNFAVHENALKWYRCELEENIVDYYLADRIWEFCKERDIPMRGHCIFWDKDQHNLPWIHQLNNEQLRRAVKRRAIGVTEHFKGRINEFDLNNEMIHNDFFRRRLGYGIVNEMAYMAKAGNPDIVLYMNDYGILTDYGCNAESYITQIRNFLASGVPIDGIGCQGHLSTYVKTPMSVEHVQKTLDKLSAFHLPIKITECLFEADDKQEQAEELKRIFPVYFAHPDVEAIVMWGFWEKDHWRPWSAMWKKDWSITPQGSAYRDLVFGRWWTKTSGITGKDGFFRTRGFYGNYEITAGGQTRKVCLSKKDKILEVAF
ncbi:MAG: endo-1,4-beta-xylanase [Spirochaetales bacterium]|nr:endo-1,4-beta-xylanase [Spirochaetales bacterium]